MTRTSVQRLERLQISEIDHLGLSEQRIERWVWGFVALGIGLRVLTYLLRFPIWTDEAKLATSLLDRGYAELLEPFAYGQIATVLFMWVQKTASLVFGFSEYSLRLIPVLSAVAGVLLMRHVARRLFLGTPMLFAVAIFAVSYYPVRHAAELKPYATDLLASLVLTAVALEWLREPTRVRWLWCFAALAPLAISLSYTAIFVAAGILICLALPVWHERGWPSRLALGVSGLLAGGTFVANLLLFAGKQYQQRSRMTIPWPGGFPAWEDPPGVLAWLVQAHTGRTFGYPLGAEHGGSVLTFAAFAVGAIVLFRARRRLHLALLLCPFGLAFVAALLGLYPYGGSGRVSQYMVPAICLLAGLGAARISSIAKRSASRRRAQACVLAFLVLFGVLFGLGSFLRPYRDRPDMIGRDFARWFWDVKSRDAELVCAWQDLRLDFARPGERGWTPGGAGYRINQRIYYKRIHRGQPPDLASVSEQRPLRVVFLGTAVHSQPDAFEEWLREMRTQYDFLGRERHDLGRFEEQHGQGDWVEIYSFVPRRPDETDPL